MQKRRALTKKVPPANGGNGNGHGKRNGGAPACASFDLCAPRILALERESAQVSATLGLLLQAQETANARLEQLTRGVAVLEGGMRLVCQAHDLNLDEFKG